MGFLCRSCGKKLESDETAINRRLGRSNSADFLCVDCLALYFKCSRQVIEEMIEHFKRTGCSFFR